MKMFFKTVMLFIILVGGTLMIDIIYDVSEILMTKYIFISLSLFMILYSYVLKKEGSVNNLSILNDSMFDNQESIDLFLNALLIYTTNIFIPVILLETISIILLNKINVYYFDIIIIGVSIIIYVYQFYKLSIKYTK